MNWVAETLAGIEPHFFNTETRKKERLNLLDPDVVRLYTCGPTVYSYAHIGNFRAYVFEDLLKRTLKMLGYHVHHVMNITDVDDKTIRNAIAQGVSLDTYTEPYKKAFFEDLDTLGLERADAYPEATDYIPQMIEMIEQLLEKGYAYTGADGSVYFSIAKFGRYGCLSHLKLDELEVGRSDRVAADEYDKESASDFVLWKGYDAERDGNIFWESPFGKGRPGWHLECSVMAMQLLGDTLDIHCGGVDNIFPHHENEIAQSESCSGKRFATQWMHCEHLIVDGKKMSKSLGNFYTLRDLLDKGHEGRIVRYMLLHTHYRAQLNFSFTELGGVTSSLHRLDALARRLREGHAGKGGILGKENRLVLRAFAEALADDLNISHALGILFDWVRETNSLLDRNQVSSQEAQEALELLQAVDSVLGVITFEEEGVPAEIENMMQERQAARQSKDFQLADTLRDKIIEMGYAIEDTPLGPRAVKSVAHKGNIS